jgi:hypothetical protein
MRNLALIDWELGMATPFRGGATMLYAVAVFAVVMGAAMTAIWTRDILFNDEVDVSAGLFRARDTDGSIFWFHWVAEYGTALLLIAGGLGLLLESVWAPYILLLGLGALLYTSMNSLGWAFARKERYAYAVPMLVGLIGGAAAAAWVVFTLL